MAEPEDILLDGARHAITFVRDLWRRRGPDGGEGPLRLADVRSRLELFVHAAYGVALPIVVAEPPARPTLLARWARRLPRHLAERRALASTDGERLRLPRALPAGPGAPVALDVYRLLAVELAARVARGTPRGLPASGGRLVRDLYLLREAEAVDAAIVRDLPGLAPALRAARTAALAERPRPVLLSEQEAFVEKALATLLAADPVGARDVSATPAESLTWAEKRAVAVRSLPGGYRGLPPVQLWGEVLPPPPPRPGGPATPETLQDAPRDRPRVSMMNRRPHVREADEGEDDEGVGMWMIQPDDPQEHVEDPMGLQRPTDRDEDADPAGLADSLSELPEARLVSTPGSPREVLVSEDPPPIRAAAASPVPDARGISYPEWDFRAGAYVVPGAVVREAVGPLGDPAWAAGVLARRAALVGRVRRRFERLRPRRVRLGRQLDGPDVDLDAYVTARADLAAGRPADDRLYETVRPARRDLAIALLVDVSASTDSWVADSLRVIDVEKEALLVVCDALDALGDPYAIYAFSGEGPAAVSVLALKSFAERNGPAVHRRIAALEPDRYTRMGAAVRHATARLMERPARHRLLLVLSDGKPNDVDRYEGRYGVEDTRQALSEARLSGLHPFCLTVDRQAPAYLPRIFGVGAYAVLQHPERLPGVLVDVLRRLVRE